MVGHLAELGRDTSGGSGHQSGISHNIGDEDRGEAAIGVRGQRPCRLQTIWLGWTLSLPRDAFFSISPIATRPAVPPERAGRFVSGRGVRAFGHPARRGLTKSAGHVGHSAREDATAILYWTNFGHSRWSVRLRH